MGARNTDTKIIIKLVFQHIRPFLTFQQVVSTVEMLNLLRNVHPFDGLLLLYRLGAL